MPESEEVTTIKAKPSFSPEYGARFRVGRKAAKVGPLAIATALGMSEQAVLQFETGKQRLDLERFVAACQCAGLNVRWVLTGLGDMFEDPTQLSKTLRPAKRSASPAPPASGQQG